MPSRDHTTAAAIASVATALDGLITGLAFAFFAAQSLAKYRRSSSALGLIRAAPYARISDLRSVLSDEDEGGSASSVKLVVLRGEVQPRSAPGSKGGGALVSQGSGERAVIVQRTSTVCLYSEWRGIFGWRFDLHAVFAKKGKERHSTSIRTVPFILVEDGHWPYRGSVNVKLEGSKYPLPLTTVYHQLLPVQATTYAFFQAMFGQGYPVALLDEEKILPVGTEITAIGLCSLHDGNLEIRPSDDLPCFLSDMTRSELEADLAFNVNILLCSGILLGVLSVGILGYAIRRNWRRLKEWRNRRQHVQEETTTAAETGADNESEEVPDGELCVICLTRRRSSSCLPRPSSPSAGEEAVLHRARPHLGYCRNSLRRATAGEEEVGRRRREEKEEKEDVSDAHYPRLPLRHPRRVLRLEDGEVPRPLPLRRCRRRRPREGSPAI